MKKVRIYAGSMSAELVEKIDKQMKDDGFTARWQWIVWVLFNYIKEKERNEQKDN